MLATPRTDAVVNAKRPYAHDETAETAFDAMSYVSRQLETENVRLRTALVHARDFVIQYQRIDGRDFSIDIEIVDDALAQTANA